VLELSSLDRFSISGRGDAVVVELDSEWVDHNDPKFLRGMSVMVDGVIHIVAGVETSLHPWRPDEGHILSRRRVSLLLSD
jgi:hypothetical protein